MALWIERDDRAAAGQGRDEAPMMAADAETRLHRVLQEMEFDLRYHAYCRRPRRGRPAAEVDRSQVANCIERLPLSFRYFRSENFSRPAVGGPR